MDDATVFTALPVLSVLNTVNNVAVPDPVTAGAATVNPNSILKCAFNTSNATTHLNVCHINGSSIMKKLMRFETSYVILTHKFWPSAKLG